MEIEIDFRSGTPIYVQIMEQIQGMVASGELKPGSQLPTVRKLAADLRINFNTVARAYRLLDEEGLISTQHGRGTYIWEEPPPEAVHRLRAHSLSELLQRTLEDAQRLGCTPEEIRTAFEEQLVEWQKSE